MNKDILNKVKQMFPEANLDNVVNQAEEITKGTQPNQIPSKLKELGINETAVNGIFNKYGNTMQAKMVLGLFGTSPERLRNDTLNLINGKANTNTPTLASKPVTTKYPRLKK